MSIRIGTGSGAVEPTEFRLGSIARGASRVMVGIGDDAVPAYVREIPTLQPMTVGSTTRTWVDETGEGTSRMIATFQVTGAGKGHFKVSLNGPAVFGDGSVIRNFGIRRNGGATFVKTWSGPSQPDQSWVMTDEVTDELTISENETFQVYLVSHAVLPSDRYINSWSIELVPSVPAVDTSTILTVSPTEAAWGDPVTLTATVTPSNAVGSVTFDGAGETSTVSLVNGVATTTRTFYAPGEYEVSAEFTPTSEEDFLPSSGTSSITVVEGAPQVVEITGTLWGESRSQLRDALTARGLDYATVETLPFALDTSQATNFNEMFRDCAALTEVPEMDTSQVTDMGSMFYGCASLSTVPEMDTSKVTNMSNMFSSCASLTTVPDMDTSQVTTMSYMFGFCNALVAAPELDTSNVTTMQGMFSWCSALAYVPDMDTENVTDMSGMFSGCGALTDGNVRLHGKHPDVDTTEMIAWSGLTVEPFVVPIPPAVETTTSLSVVPNEITEGESITLTATVTPTDAVGSVTFTVAGETSTVVVVNGTATGTLTVDLAGTHEVSADFVPTNELDFLPSSGTGSLTVLEFVPAVETSTVLSVVPNEITEGEQVTLTATVTPSEAVGEVTFAVGTQTYTVALAGGTASTTATLDDPGSYEATASFVPTDEADFTASSDTASITVIPDPVETQTTLLVVPEELEEGELVTVTATVTPAEAAGSVEFDVAGQLSTVNVVNGEAITTATLDEAGEHAITAGFVPTSELDFLPSSATSSVTVTEPAPAGVVPMSWSDDTSRTLGGFEYEVLSYTVTGTGSATFSALCISTFSYTFVRRMYLYVNGTQVGSGVSRASGTYTLKRTWSGIQLHAGDIVTFSVGGEVRTVEWSLELIPE